MEYSFLADLLDTFQSLPDWLKPVALLVPFISVLGLWITFLDHCRKMRKLALGAMRDTLNGEASRQHRLLFKAGDYNLIEALDADAELLDLCDKTRE
jgi:hypothetical protein